MGAVYGALGYKSRANPKESFDGVKFGSAVVVGGIAGAVLTYSGVTFDEPVIDNFVALASTIGTFETLKRIARLIKIK